MNNRNRRPVLILVLLGILLILLVVGAGLFLAANRHGAGDTPTPGATASPSGQLYSPAPSATISVSAGATTSFTFDIISSTLLDAARADLPKLAVRGRTSMAGYSRDQFGPSWTDNCTALGCHNSCDTRDDILARDLVNDVLKSDNCTVLSGTLYDPYTAKRIVFVRGANSSIVQIDHLVALGNAWVSGAAGLSAAERTNLANDPLNLVAVDGPTNGAKGDGAAEQWLPPAPASHCAYVVHQVEVKMAYHLWVTVAEQAAMAGVLATC